MIPEKPEERFFYDLFNFFFDVADVQEREEQQRVIDIIRNSACAARGGQLMSEETVVGFEQFRCGSGVKDYTEIIENAARCFEDSIECANADYLDSCND